MRPRSAEHGQIRNSGRPSDPAGPKYPEYSGSAILFVDKSSGRRPVGMRTNKYQKKDYSDLDMALSGCRAAWQCLELTPGGNVPEFLHSRRQGER
jgi:hypothetical protein